MINEFRQDLISGEWVLFATGRARRPGERQAPLETDRPEAVVAVPSAGRSLTGQAPLGARRLLQPRENCPFENPEESGSEVMATYFNKAGTNWIAKAIKNKFPAVTEGETGDMRQVGPFKVLEGTGLHEVLVFRDHERDFYDFSGEEMAEIFGVYQKRYLAMLDSGSRKYTLIFHNHGAQAGATVQHPHSQIISIPILPPDVKRSVEGSENFYRKHGRKVYDVMLEWEMGEKKRIVYENENFLVFCPFVSKTEYEVRIFSKEGHAHFEEVSKGLLADLGDAFSAAFKKIGKALDKPDYNFFIHTSPIGPSSPKAHEFYSWHIEILPKVASVGAFELASGMEINVIDPDEAAKLFRETEI